MRVVVVVVVVYRQGPDLPVDKFWHVLFLFQMRLFDLEHPNLSV